MAEVFVVVPVFKEFYYMENFIASWECVKGHVITLIVANGSPGDETSQLIENYNGPLSVNEIEGSASLFWAGLVSLGLKEICNRAQLPDYVVLTNVDITFVGDPLSPMLKEMESGQKRQLAAMVQTQGGQMLSAGVLVRSWACSRNHHLLPNVDRQQYEATKLPVTYLPTRFLVFPAEVLVTVGIPDAKHLPHYCADYEYSNRLRIAGYQPFVYTGSLVDNKDLNTGFKTFEQNTSFWERLNKCFDMKCSYNLKHRFWFVMLAYPGWTKFPGVFSHFLKIALEVVFGGARLRKMRDRAVEAEN